MVNNEVPKWTWHGKEIPINQLDYSQLYSIKNTLQQSNKAWWGQSKHYWLKNINQLIKKQEEVNINQISRNKAFKTTVAANGIADKVIRLFRTNEERNQNKGAVKKES